MSNLGRYQDLVMEAKRLGGADALVKEVARNAIKTAAPKLVGAGVVVGLALGAGATVGKRRWDEFRARSVAAQVELARRVRDGSAPDEPEVRADESPAL